MVSWTKQKVLIFVLELSSLFHNNFSTFGNRNENATEQIQAVSLHANYVSILPGKSNDNKHIRWCCPWGKSLGLEASRGQKLKSSSWDKSLGLEVKKSWSRHKSWSWNKSLGLEVKNHGLALEISLGLEVKNLGLDMKVLVLRWKVLVLR